MMASTVQPVADHGSIRASDSRATPAINRAQRCLKFSGRHLAVAPSQQGAIPSFIAHPAQQDNCFTSLVKVWAVSFSPSTIVR